MCLGLLDGFLQLFFEASNTAGLLTIFWQEVLLQVNHMLGKKILLA